MPTFVESQTVQEELLLTLIDKTELLAEAHLTFSRELDPILRKVENFNVLEHFKVPVARTEHEEAHDLHRQIRHAQMCGVEKVSIVPIVHAANIAHLRRNGFTVVPSDATFTRPYKSLHEVTWVSRDLTE